MLVSSDLKPAFITPAFGNDWLTHLHEVQLPGGISWLPNAPVWWLLVAVLAVGVCRWGWRCYRRWCGQAYRREALRILQQWQTGRESRAVVARALPELIRRVALTAWPRRQVASLTGQAWYVFLKQTSETLSPPENLRYLAHWPEHRLAALTEREWTELMDWARAWILLHQPEARL